MTMKRWNGSSWIDQTMPVKRWNGSSWVNLTVAKRWTGSAWVTMFPTLTASSSPTEDAISYPVPKTTTTFTVTPSGGNGNNITYSWAKQSGDFQWTINSPSSSSTTFTRNQNTDNIAVFRCTVSDGDQTTTVDVTVEYISDL